MSKIDERFYVKPIDVSIVCERDTSPKIAKLGRNATLVEVLTTQHFVVNMSLIQMPVLARKKSPIQLQALP